MPFHRTESEPESRVSHRRNTFLKFGKDDVLKQARDFLEEAVILNPNTPAAQLSELLVGTDEPERTAALHLILECDFYRRGILAIRRKQTAADRAQLALPGFELLPLKIPGKKGALIDLLDANTFRVQQYYDSLMKAHRERKHNSPKIRQAKTLLDLMTEACTREKGITVREVVLLGK